MTPNNPYTPGNPVQDASMFFGRDDIFGQIKAFLIGNQSVSIIGPPQIGKTSLLLHLKRPETRSALGLPDEYLLVYLKCKALSTNQTDAIIAHFSSKIASEIQMQGLVPEPALAQAVAKPLWSAFELALRRLNQRGQKLVLMLDGFEWLSENPRISVNFYNALRSAAGRQWIIYITASTAPLVELTYLKNTEQVLSSPFFNIFSQLLLGLLTESEARNLVKLPMKRMDLAVNTQLEEFILRFAGRHPLALQVACSHACEHPDNPGLVEHKTRQDLDVIFKNIWNNLSSSERELLQHLDEVGLRDRGTKTFSILLRELQRKCLLVQEGSSYNLPSRAWAEFVSTQVPDSISISPG